LTIYTERRSEKVTYIFGCFPTFSFHTSLQILPSSRTDGPVRLQHFFPYPSTCHQLARRPKNRRAIAGPGSCQTHPPLWQGSPATTNDSVLDQTS